MVRRLGVVAVVVAVAVVGLAPAAPPTPRTHRPRTHRLRAAVRMVAALLALHSDLGGQELRTGLARAEWGDPALAEAIEQEVVRVRPSFTVITVGEIAELVELAVWSG